MATFTPVTRTNKEFNAVYIRISARSTTDYIRTSYLIHKSNINKRNEITDNIILANCYSQIKEYIGKLAEYNSESWTAKEIKNLLLSDKQGISFSKFADKYIGKMYNEHRDKSVANYRTAIRSLSLFLGTNDIMFSDITSSTIRKWVDALSHTKRAKNMYPICIQKLFEEGCLEYNDYDKNIIKIPHQPFRAVKIPKVDVPEPRAVGPDVIKKILSATPIYPREQMAIDVCLMVISLAGINTVDLYKMLPDCLRDHKLCYNRAKTKNTRPDKAYIEIAIPEHIRYLIDVYKGKDHLFNFAEQYHTPDYFSTAVNKGLLSVCTRYNLPKVTTYVFRHSWATIAQNVCGFSTEQVAFALNHTSAHKVTMGYIKKDFSVIDRMNEAVWQVISDY